MNNPAAVRVPAPKGLAQVPPDLAAAFAAPGYSVTIDGSDLIVSRTGKMSLPADPGATAPLVGAPFQPQEVKNLAGLVAAWEAGQA